MTREIPRTMLFRQERRIPKIRKEKKNSKGKFLLKFKNGDLLHKAIHSGLPSYAKHNDNNEKNANRINGFKRLYLCIGNGIKAS